VKWSDLSNKSLDGEDDLKMKFRLQDISRDNQDETFDDCDQQAFK